MCWNYCDDDCSTCDQREQNEKDAAIRKELMLENPLLQEMIEIDSIYNI